jgi:outer membrane protein assembly factor BamB
MRTFIAHHVENRILLSLFSVVVLALSAFGPTVAQAQGGSTLIANQQLNIGDQLLSVNGRARLAMQSDGNLVLYRTDTGAALWSTGTAGKPVTHALMQTDGNFVLYNSNNSVAYWNAGTFGHPGASLQLQDDANLAILNQNGTLLWQTNTAQLWSAPAPVYRKV